MLIPSIIKADKPTVNNRVYSYADLMKLFEYLYPLILQGKCLVWYNEDTLVTESAVGIVKDAYILDDVIMFDIQLFSNHEVLYTLNTINHLRIDLILDILVNDIKDNSINLTDFKVEGLKLVKI